jgi:hypothetical protein
MNELDPLENNGLPVGNQWEAAAGVICPECKQETFQIVDGVCIRCHKKKEGESEDKLADKAERRYLKDQLREGTISLDQLLHQGDPDS